MVAHSISVITAQTGYGHLVVDAKPHQARAALAMIETAGPMNSKGPCDEVEPGKGRDGGAIDIPMPRGSARGPAEGVDPAASGQCLTAQRWIRQPGVSERSL